MGIQIQWQSNTLFKTSNDIIIDMGIDKGGSGQGANPKELFLQSIGSCMGISMISIFRKSRLAEPDNFLIGAYFETDQGKQLKSVNIELKIRGSVNKADILKAFKLSKEKYCPISILVSKAIKINYKLILNDEVLEIN